MFGYYSYYDSYFWRPRPKRTSPSPGLPLELTWLNTEFHTTPAVISGVTTGAAHPRLTQSETGPPDETHGDVQ